MLKRNRKGKMPNPGNMSVFRKLETSLAASDHSLAENVDSFRTVPPDIRKREASKHLYLERYE